MKQTLSIYILLLVLSFAGMMGCKKSQGDLSSYHPIDDTKKDTLRLFNLLTDVANPYGTSNGYLLYVNDSLRLFEGNSVIPNFHSYGIPQVLALPAQGVSMNLKIVKFKNSSYYETTAPPAAYSDKLQLVMERTVTLPAHTGVGNLIFFDSAGKNAMHYMPATTMDPGAPARGTFKIRVVNFAYNMPDLYNYSSSLLNSAGPKYHVQLRLPDSSVVQGYEDLAFGTEGDYKSFDYGTIQFLLYNLTASKYITNSGSMNDMAGVFNYTRPPLAGESYTNTVFPTLNYGNFNSLSTAHYGNRGSYPFAPGGCYTILILGNIYAVALDRMYGAGDLDNVGKIQMVNADPGQQDLQVTLQYTGGEKSITDLSFGTAGEPVTLPAGPVNCIFSSKGQQIYSYQTDVTRLSHKTLFFSEDLNHVPFIYPVTNIITEIDYINNGVYTPPVRELNKMTFLNLSPDAGSLYVTREGGAYAGGTELTIFNDNTYKKVTDPVNTDGTVLPTAYNIRLSNNRADTLAGQKVASVVRPYNRSSAPGKYMLVSAGLLNSSEPSSRIKLFVVKQTNYTPKAH